MGKYKNKYRIASTRLPHWDYGANALYFITICTVNKQCYFGSVANGEMVLSDMGEFAEKYWLEIPQHFPFVILHNHVVMPNHVHGIIEIAKSNDDDGRNNERNGPDGRTVETQNLASLQPPPSHQPPSLTPSSSDPNKPKNQFGPQSRNLASIVRGFKIGVTKNARFIDPEFAWQPRYHDIIIRTYESYYHISNYITDNPSNWTKDKFHAAK